MNWREYFKIYFFVCVVAILGILFGFTTCYQAFMWGWLPI